jgi:hypothetical protein
VDHDQLIAALAALLVAQGGIIVLLVKTFVSSRTAAAQATAANMATNGIGEGEHRLYDMVSHIRDEISVLTEAQADFHRRNWRNLPDDLNDAMKLTLKVRQLEAADKADQEAHQVILKDLRDLRAEVQKMGNHPLT